MPTDSNLTALFAKKISTIKQTDNVSALASKKVDPTESSGVVLDKEKEKGDLTAVLSKALEQTCLDSYLSKTIGTTKIIK